MNLDDAITEIKEGLSYRRTGDEEITRAIQRAQFTLEKPGRTLPWFLVKENQLLSTVANQDYVDLPDDFIKEVDYSPLRYSYDGSISPNVKYLVKGNDKSIRAYFTNESGIVISGGPDQYILLKDTIRIYPTPDLVYSLYWDYYGKADELTTGGDENAWLDNNPDILIGLAGFYVAQRKRDQGAVSLFQGQYNNGQRQLISDNEERDLANRTLAKGSKT